MKAIFIFYISKIDIFGGIHETINHPIKIDNMEW